MMTPEAKSGPSTKIKLALGLFLALGALILFQYRRALFGPSTEGVPNALVGEPNTNCKEDSDCRLEMRDPCNIKACDCPIVAVNIDWQPSCRHPFRTYHSPEINQKCAPCQPQVVACVAGTCAIKP